MADSSNTTPLSNKDLVNLASRLRDGADNMLADRSLADDLRQAADLASRWANIREGWKDPDLSYDAIHELGCLLHDHNETGEAVRTTDVYLATLAVDRLCSWATKVREFPNAPADYDFRKAASWMLIGLATEPFTDEQWKILITPPLR
jgi:hypothetical protein